MINRIGIVCNTINPDMAVYFKAKVEYLNDNEFLFYGNSVYCEDKRVKVCSISKKSTFTYLFIVDALLAFYVVMHMKMHGVNKVLFDTAHVSNIPLSILCKVMFIKCIFTVHDWSPHEGSNNKATQIYNEYVDKYLADEYVVFSKVETEKKYYKFVLGGFTQKKKVDKKGEYFLFFGRIEPYKGIDKLMQISKKILHINEDIKIVVAGKGDDQCLSDLKKMPNVKVINKYIEQKELDDLASKTIAIILPYKSATQSGVVIVSYSYSVPVVAFNVGALSEYVEHGQTGELVNPYDIDGFVDSMISVLNNQKYYNDIIYDKYQRLYAKRVFAEQYMNIKC